MITAHELIALGFEFNPGPDEWSRNSIKIYLNDGEITFIRQNDNYHGLSISISTETDLNNFIAYVDE